MPDSPHAPLVPKSGLALFEHHALHDDLLLDGSNEAIISHEDWEDVPYSDNRLDAIFAFEMKVAGGTVFGTAFAVSSNLLLSAAHNWEDDDSSSANFDVRRYRAGNTHTRMIAKSDTHAFKHNTADMGGISINKHRFGEQLEILEADKIDASDTISVLGYPAEKSPVPYIGAGKILSIEDNLIYHDADTERGQSGAPILNSAGGVIGVHLGGPEYSKRTDQNLGHIFDAATMRKIRTW